jgi:hypothetical protein
MNEVDYDSPSNLLKFSSKISYKNENSVKNKNMFTPKREGGNNENDAPFMDPSSMFLKTPKNKGHNIHLDNIMGNSENKLGNGISFFN